jgi:cytoskeletal protein CcmA (bactofilin family)
MWKRDESVRPSVTRDTAVTQPPATSPSASGSHAHAPEVEGRRHTESRDVVNIGKSVVIRGELNASEDLTVEGHVEGKIELKQNVLTIGPNGRINAEIFAKVVVVLGQVTGDITASEKVDIRDNGNVEGKLLAPRVAIAEGAQFRGSIDMGRRADAKAEAKATDAPKNAEAAKAAEVKPAAQPQQKG